MMPDAPPWLQRWLQREDEDLLYVDQTLVRERSLTLEELDQAIEVTRQHALRQAQAPQAEEDHDEP